MVHGKVEKSDEFDDSFGDDFNFDDEEEVNSEIRVSDVHDEELPQPKKQLGEELLEFLGHVEPEPTVEEQQPEEQFQLHQEEEKSEPSELKESAEVLQEELHQAQMLTHEKYTHGFDNSFDLALLDEFDVCEKALPPMLDDDDDY